MEDILNNVFSYGFHDTDIDNIIIENNEIILCFDKGLYTLDENNNEDKLVLGIKMIITVELFNECGDASDNINVWESKNGDLNLKNVLKKISKSSFGIENLYFSSFNNSILIDGYYNNESNFRKGINHKMLIVIENCIKIRYERNLL